MLNSYNVLKKIKNKKVVRILAILLASSIQDLIPRYDKFDHVLPEELDVIDFQELGLLRAGIQENS
jgi:hypothetical protein